VFKNKIVMITGASSGIGAASAQQFAAQGAKLILIARRAERLEELVTQLRKQYSVSILSISMDITDHDAVKHAIENLPQDWQAIDLLLNNAGLAAGFDKLYQSDIQDWEAMIDTNVKGLLYMTRYVVPGMVARNQGHIINIGSIAGHQTYANGSVYCGSKAAVRSISQGLKLDLTGTAVRVTSIDPGMVNTEFSLVRFKGDNERADNVYKGMTPLTPDDIADTILFCANRPAHVNIAEMILFPTDQSSATVVHRR
jgi:serine 3-dehydrogenase